MTHIVVPQWKKEKPATLGPSLDDEEVDLMSGEIRDILDLLVSKIKGGDHGLDNKLLVLHSTTLALRDGDRVKVTITK